MVRCPAAEPRAIFCCPIPRLSRAHERCYNKAKRLLASPDGGGAAAAAGAAAGMPSAGACLPFFARRSAAVPQVRTAWFPPLERPRP